MRLKNLVVACIYRVTVVLPAIAGLGSLAGCASKSVPEKLLDAAKKGADTSPFWEDGKPVAELINVMSYEILDPVQASAVEAKKLNRQAGICRAAATDVASEALDIESRQPQRSVAWLGAAVKLNERADALDEEAKAALTKEGGGTVFRARVRSTNRAGMEIVVTWLFPTNEAGLVTEMLNELDEPPSQEEILNESMAARSEANEEVPDLSSLQGAATERAPVVLLEAPEPEAGADPANPVDLVVTSLDDAGRLEGTDGDGASVVIQTGAAQMAGTPKPGARVRVRWRRDDARLAATSVVVLDDVPKGGDRPSSLSRMSMPDGSKSDRR